MEGSTEAEPKYKYTIQLRAEYADAEAPTPTHINWYAGFETNGSEACVEENDLQINEAVDIKPANTFTRENYEFIGWARVTEYEHKNETTGEVTYTHAPVTKDDLFLKYDNGNWYAEDENGEFNVKVDQVAADEFSPYHALVALWEGQFKIWHSSTAVSETVVIPESGQFDLVSKVEPGYLYGGYYTTVKDDKDPYTGIDQDSYWADLTPYTEDGRNMTPVAGTTYYLKEVPEAYFRPYMQYYYRKGYGGFITRLYILTALDDKRYQEVGFAKLIDETGYGTPAYNADGTKKMSGDVQEILKISILPAELANSSDRTDNTKKIFKTVEFASNGVVTEDNRITAAKLVEKNGSTANAGYVASMDLSDIGHVKESDLFYNVDKSFSGVKFNYVPYYVTFDGVTVIGNKLRIVDMHDGYVSQLKPEESLHTLNDVIWPGKVSEGGN